MGIIDKMGQTARIAPASHHAYYTHFAYHAGPSVTPSQPLLASMPAQP
ncbi:hypothetical protein AAAT34_02005 [Hallella faecis]|uniref:Uncharacterized protein n=1 Tax=Hallella faecis TaxID=2841596 RepID=A0ABV1FN48_9BACT|nr:hypothetical protein [Hallella faecis]MBU0288958.1 hypothetical protein [Hallella faecis]